MLCISTSKHMHPKIMKNVPFTSCVREAHVRLVKKGLSDRLFVAYQLIFYRSSTSQTGQTVRSSFLAYQTSLGLSGSCEHCGLSAVCWFYSRINKNSSTSLWLGSTRLVSGKNQNKECTNTHTHTHTHTHVQSLRKQMSNSLCSSVIEKTI